MKKIVIGCMFLIAFSVQGQGISVLDRLDNAGASGSLFRNKVLEKKKERIEGTPYLNEVFMSSSISGVENIFLTRYNAFTDEVEVSYDESIFVIPKDEQYSTIVNKPLEYKLQLMRYNASDENYVYGYLFELFATEKVGLYKREQVVLQEAREAANSYATSVPPKYAKKSEEYFLKMNAEKVVPFPKNKKGLNNLYSGKSGESIKAYLKSEKISFKNQADLIKLTKFISTL